MPLLLFSSFAIFTSSYTQADPFGKGIFVFLFLLSFTASFVLVYKAWLIHSVKKRSYVFQAKALESKESLLELTLPKQDPLLPHPFASIYRSLREKTLEILEKNRYFADNNHTFLSERDIEIIEAHLHSTMRQESKKLSKYLFILSLIVTLAPFLGLLGTVWGILITFFELEKGASLGTSSLILGGLSTALTTTVLGLLIAIPALIAYHSLKNGLKSFELDVEDFSHKLISIIEMQYRKVDLP